MAEQRQLNYGEAIRKLRGMMTLEALAEAAGMSPSYLSEVERGLKRPSTDVVAKVARALGMSPSAFLEYVEGLSGHEPVAFMMAGAKPPAATPAPQVPKEDVDSPNLRLLISHARELDESDLKTLVDLARRLLKKEKS